jgi:hypothetical protein
MTAFQRFASAAALAAIAVSSIAAGSASANVVSIVRWECPDGFWHVRTSEATDGGPEVLVKDEATTSACPRTESAPAQLNSTYQLQPKYDFRPQLRYSIEEPQPPKPTRIPLRYAF